MFQIVQVIGLAIMVFIASSGCVTNRPPPCETYEPVTLEDMLADPVTYHYKCIRTSGYLGPSESHYGGMPGPSYPFYPDFDDLSRFIEVAIAASFEENLTKERIIEGRYHVDEEYIGKIPNALTMIADRVRDADRGEDGRMTTTSSG